MERFSGNRINVAALMAAARARLRSPEAGSGKTIAARTTTRPSKSPDVVAMRSQASGKSDKPTPSEGEGQNGKKEGGKQSTSVWNPFGLIAVLS